MFRLQKCQYLGENRQQHALAGLTTVDTVYNEKGIQQKKPEQNIWSRVNGKRS